MSVYLQVRCLMWSSLFMLLMILLIASGQYWLEEDPAQQFSNDTFTINPLNKGERQLQEIIKVSEILPNCGIQEECPENSIPVHVYTGQDKNDQPKLCIQGKYVIGGNINGGGRGLNAAIVDSTHFQVVAVQNFDLYSQNSTSLEHWLANQVLDNDIIIAFTFDEASKELSRKAKTSLYKLGSGKIQDLQFRSQWYMISQKGIHGFTSLENLTYAKNDQWGDVIDEHLCVPRHIPPMAVTPDPNPKFNKMREKICNSTVELQCEEFCGATAQQEAIYPALLTNRSLIGNPVYSSPVIVVAGKSLSSLILTLESLIYQPGIHAPSVFVLYTNGQDKVPEIAKLFSFQSLFVNSTSNNEHLYAGLHAVKENFQHKKYVIIIEEGLILSPDFLFYMAQISPVLEKDESILAISAWNPNGYKSVSGNHYLAYRSEHFPGLGFLMPMWVFDKYIDTNFSCCTQPAVLGWDQVIDGSKGNVIIPDVSRVMRRPSDLLYLDSSDIEYNLFMKERLTNTDSTVWINKPQNLEKDRYFHQIAMLMQDSTTFHLTEADLKLCKEGGNMAIIMMLQQLSGKVLVVYYKEDFTGSFNNLRTLTKCFRIFIPDTIKPQGIYQKLFRFTVNDNTVLLIESASPFYRSKLPLVTK